MGSSRSGSFEHELKSLNEIFAKKRRFLIPAYQRGYSWEEQHRADLLTDIEYVIRGDFAYRHYAGTIVVSPSERERSIAAKGEYKIFDIVDGQQRLTSLVLLLSVIYRFSQQSSNQIICDSDCRDIFSTFIQGGSEGNSIQKLTLGKDQNDLFRNLTVNGKNTATEESVKSKSDKNLINAIDEYEKWLEKNKLSCVIKCVRNYLGFLFYAPENTKEIGIMFEVINNRGKPLSELEKIKNYFIYYADKNNMSDIKNAVDQNWPIIITKLNQIGYTSNSSENEFLRNCWIVFMDPNKRNSHHVYSSLKQKWPPDDSSKTKEIIKFIKFLGDSSVYYSMYLQRQDVKNKQERSWLERISCHSADASITPLLLAIFHKVNDTEERIPLFELLEKLNFRFYGTGIAGRSDSGQGELFENANTFFGYCGQKKDGIEIDIKWLKGELIRFISERANDKSFVESLTLDKDEAGDYYDWVGLKFFLASYEEKLRRDKKESLDLKKFLAPRDPRVPNDFCHKEHIWAKKDYTRLDDRLSINVNKRRLGNFLLLKEADNIRVSNRPPEEKVELYFNEAPNTWMILKLKKFFDDSVKEEEVNWKRKTRNYWIKVYKRFFDQREEEMINFALERWRVPELKDNISKVKLNSLRCNNLIYDLVYEKGH